jgi:tetratricopeptide (TPR) repeat protein
MHRSLSIPLSLCVSLAPLVTLAVACGGTAADGPARTPAPAGTTAAPARTTAAPSRADAPARAAAPAPATAPSSAEKEERFDLLVRDDFFAGLLEQDSAALDRAMKLCEDTLARDPNHAEAMVWHGGGLIMRAGNAFRAGDRATGGRLWTQGLAEMDRAVELEPDNVGTRIPRGSVLLAVAQYAPPQVRTVLLEKAVGDYEHTLKLQKHEFDRLSRHARSQLLYGLADGWQRRGDQARARAYYQRLSSVAGDSAYGKRARAYLAGDTAPRKMQCGGCHAE